MNFCGVNWVVQRQLPVERQNNIFESLFVLLYLVFRPDRTENEYSSHIEKGEIFGVYTTQYGLPKKRQDVKVGKINPFIWKFVRPFSL